MTERRAYEAPALTDLREETARRLVTALEVMGVPSRIQRDPVALVWDYGPGKCVTIWQPADEAQAIMVSFA